MPSKEELKALQALPLEIKVMKTQARIREWVQHFGEDGVYVSFSGGKDSTVLLHLVRELYPNVEAVFINTGLEYPEIQSFVKTFENVTILRPKISFIDVIKKYGYPLISKEVSECTSQAKESLKRNDGKYSYRLKKLLGTAIDKQGRKSLYNQEKWKPLLYVDFKISNACCGVMKKSPVRTYERKAHKFPMLAMLAEESNLREKIWMKTGCNAFSAKHQNSKPMSFWTEQDVLHYIDEHKLPIAKVYGGIVPDADFNGQIAIDDSLVKLKCTGCERTGCIFCAFGAHLEKGEGRFERLKRTHPKQYAFCMEGGEHNEEGLWQPNEKGLGMKHVFDVFNELYPKTPIKY